MTKLKSYKDKLQSLTTEYDALHSQLKTTEGSGDEKKIKELLAKIHIIAAEQNKVSERISASEKTRELENAFDVVIDTVNL